MCYFFHCRLILTQKEDLGFIMNPWSFFFIGYVFSQPLAPSAVACDKLYHRASAHRWQVVPFCVLGSSNGIS
ncbi:hypothetical protein DXB45_11700 [Clostridium sp. OM04-12AA]|nr:hypothetical protein DXB45_11700 [Clostridium sp. OM04-12AA]